MNSLIPTNSHNDLLDLIPSDRGFLDAISRPLRRYFLLKAQKELALKKMDQIKEAREDLLKAIVLICGCQNPNPEICDHLLQIYKDLF